MEMVLGISDFVSCIFPVFMSIFFAHIVYGKHFEDAIAFLGVAVMPFHSRGVW